MTIIRSDKVKHYRLRQDVTAILAGLPINVADHSDGLMLVMHDAIYARMVSEGMSESSATRKHPSWHAVPAHVRASLTKDLHAAIAYSELSGGDAWRSGAVYDPIIDIEEGRA